MAKYKKAPSSEWLAFPVLKDEDIEQESFRHSRFLVESIVKNRMGRINVLMEYEDYMKFLDAVKKKFGDISSLNVEKASKEALMKWTEEIE